MSPEDEPEADDSLVQSEAESLARMEAESLAQVEAGGIPRAAEDRLSGVGAGTGAFTSQLSVADFALCDRLGLRALAQVMGSSIYQFGYQQSSGWGMETAGSFMFELDVLSEAWNESRERALRRLGHEARLVGADAVIGVRLRADSRDWAENSLEYQLTGTAVCTKDRHGPPGSPVLTELSVADYSKLREAGVELLGIVAWSSVFFVAASYSGQMLRNLSFTQNQELPEYTQAIYSARESVVRHLTLQSNEMGATGVIGVRIDHNARSTNVGAGRYERGGLMVEFHAIGTAIRETDAPPSFAPETTIDLGARPAIDLTI